MASTPTAQPTPPPVARPEPREIVIYSHSSLFYWWPVWAVGFLMVLLTAADGHRILLVPSGSKVHQEGGSYRLEPPQGKTLQSDDGEPVQPHLHMATSKSLGVLFASVLLLIIFISNVPLRGLWSLTIVLLVVLLVVIFALAGWWGRIVENFNLIDIRINLGGYLYISLILFIIWALTVFVFDHRTYVVVTPGQVRLCLAVGAGETVYDTTGMTFEKHQNDLFRHWIVGLGSGDLIIHRSNTNQEIDMPNVLFIGAKVKEIEQLIKERQVVS
jgi:hypothetical protein